MGERTGIDAIRHYLRMREAMPLRSLGDSVHHIHASTEYEAELTVSDLTAAVEQFGAHAQRTPASERLKLADQYEAGLRKMEAAGYTDFDQAIRDHKVVIAALRAPEAADAGACCGKPNVIDNGMDAPTIECCRAADAGGVKPLRWMRWSEAHREWIYSATDPSKPIAGGYEGAIPLYASPSDAGMRAGLYIDDNAIEWLCAEVFGKVMVAKADDCTAVSKELFEQWGWRVTSTESADSERAGDGLRRRFAAAMLEDGAAEVTSTERGGVDNG